MQTSSFYVDTGHSRGCRRAHFRVHTRLPLRLTRLSPDRAEELVWEIGAAKRPEGEIFQSQWFPYLRRVEAKLDLLLNHFGYEVERPLELGEVKNLVLSGSGLCCETGELFGIGEDVQVDMLLPEDPPRPVRVLARVVSRGPGASPGTGGSVAVGYRTIDEGDRDAIIRHAYEVQRLHLRQRAERRRES